MSKRSLMLFVLLALAACGILLARSCGETRSSGSSATTTVSRAERIADGDDIAPAQADARALGIAKQREDDMRAAVATLHRYLTALGSADRAKADAFWTGKRPPAATGEADLRSLKNLRAFRIENGTPMALDSQAVPNAFEIPVELRATVSKGPPQHYRGRYRMRRAVADGGWEITSASIDTVKR